MKLVTNLDFNKLQSLNRVTQNLATAPGSPVSGLEYYDTASNCSFEWNGTAWISRDAAKVPNGYIPLAKLVTDPLARANHTGTQASSTISDLATVVKAYPLSSFANPTANIPMAGFTFSGLGTPTAAGQAAEYSWVVSQIQASAAGIDNKPSVLVVSTTNVTLLSGVSNTIDGVLLNTPGVRVLLVGQTTPSQNGPWVVQVGVWIRPVGETVTPQSFYMAEQGTSNAGSQWKVSTTGTIVLDTTPLTISQFGVSSTYSAGNGLQLSGSTFSVVTPASSGLSVGVSGITAILQANSGLSIGTTGFAVQLQSSSGLVLGATGLAIDTSVVSRKFSVTIGDGASTTLPIYHNLNTLDVLVQVRDVATNTMVIADVMNVSVNTSSVTFAVAPAINSYRVTCIG